MKYYKLLTELISEEKNIKVTKKDFVHDLGNNVKTKKIIPPNQISNSSQHTVNIDWNTNSVNIDINGIGSAQNGYLYHSTFNGNVDNIMSDGIIPNKYNNWEDWSEKGFSYFAKSPKDALQWAEDMFNEQLADTGDVK